MQEEEKWGRRKEYSAACENRARDLLFSSQKTMLLNVVFFPISRENVESIYDNVIGYRKEYFAKCNFLHLFSLLSRSITVSQINRDILPFRSVWTPTRTSRRLRTPQSGARAMKKGPCRWIIETWGESKGAGFLKDGSRTPSFSDIYWTGRHAGSHAWELVEPCALLLLRGRWKFSMNLMLSFYLHQLLLHYFMRRWISTEWTLWWLRGTVVGLIFTTGGCVSWALDSLGPRLKSHPPSGSWLWGCWIS